MGEMIKHLQVRLILGSDAWVCGFVKKRSTPTVFVNKQNIWLIIDKKPREG
jgi:hypothetical protein